MKIFFSSDYHFNHGNIIKYSNRPYKNVFEMNNDLINRWNSRISKEDTIYYLGDFFWGFDKDIEYMKEITSRLNGKKILIRGNHDHYSRNDYLNAGWESIHDIFSKEFTLNDKRYYIVMCHYAMKFWDRSHYGSIHLYGHEHFKRSIDFEAYKKLEMSTRCMNVCADGNNLYPYMLEEVVDSLKNNPVNFK